MNKLNGKCKYNNFAFNKNDNIHKSEAQESDDVTSIE